MTSYGYICLHRKVKGLIRMSLLKSGPFFSKILFKQTKQSTESIGSNYPLESWSRLKPTLETNLQSKPGLNIFMTCGESIIGVSSVETPPPIQGFGALTENTFLFEKKIIPFVFDFFKNIIPQSDRNNLRMEQSLGGKVERKILVTTRLGHFYQSNKKKLYTFGMVNVVKTERNFKSLFECSINCLSIDF